MRRVYAPHIVFCDQVCDLTDKCINFGDVNLFFVCKRQKRFVLTWIYEQIIIMFFRFFFRFVPANHRGLWIIQKKKRTGRTTFEVAQRNKNYVPKTWKYIYTHFCLLSGNWLHNIFVLVCNLFRIVSQSTSSPNIDYIRLEHQSCSACGPLNRIFSFFF